MLQLAGLGQKAVGGQIWVERKAKIYVGGRQYPSQKEEDQPTSTY